MRVANIFCVLSLTVTIFALSLVGAGPTQHPFPRAKGTIWTYQGTIRWTRDNSSRVSRAHLSWRTEIVRFVQHNNLRAAVFRG
jgi:hypothetical protein